MSPILTPANAATAMMARRAAGAALRIVLICSKCWAAARLRAGPFKLPIG
jgi:hypothetical protein